MMLRIQLERQGKLQLPVAARVLQHLRPDAASGCAARKKDAIVMHPGPMNRGVEIASRRRRRSVALGDPRAGHERRGGADGGAVSAGGAHGVRHD